MMEKGGAPVGFKTPTLKTRRRSRFSNGSNRSSHAAPDSVVHDDAVLTTRKPNLSQQGWEDSPFSPLALGLQTVKEQADFIGEVFKLRGKEKSFRKLKDSTDVEPIWKLQEQLLNSRTLISRRGNSSPRVSSEVIEALHNFVQPPRYQPQSRVCPVALQQGDVVLQRGQAHCVELRNIRNGDQTEDFVLPVLQLFVGPYSVKHVDNRVGDAVKLSMQFVFDKRVASSSEFDGNVADALMVERTSTCHDDHGNFADMKKEKKTAEPSGTSKSTSNRYAEKTPPPAIATTSNNTTSNNTTTNNNNKKNTARTQNLLKHGGKIRFTAVFPENENTVEARVATLPQVSTMIVIVVVVLFLTFKFHWGVGVLFLTAMAKRFYDFLQNSVFHPYKGTVEFEVNVDDITGIQYSHRLTEDGVFTLEVPKCLMTHYGDTNDVKDEVVKAPATTATANEAAPTPNLTKVENIPVKNLQTGNEQSGNSNSNSNSTNSTLRNRKKNKSKKRSLQFDLDASTQEQDHKQEDDSASNVTGHEHVSTASTATTTATTSQQTMLETTMIRISFNEPLVHPIVSSFVQRHEKLTHLSEDGLPGWATFLALYGLFYRKWMRTAMDAGLWVASISLMMIAMYDLFQNVSAVRHLVSWLFGSWFDWFENAVMMRIMLILPQLTIISSLWRLLQNLFGGMKNLCMTCASCMTPCLQCGRLLMMTLAECGKYVCCCCRGSQAAVNAAAKAAPSGSMVMRCYKMVNWVVTLFRRLILGGIGRIGVWLMSHWTSLYRDIVAKRLRTALVVGVLTIVLVYFLT